VRLRAVLPPNADGSGQGIALEMPDGGVMRCLLSATDAAALHAALLPDYWKSPSASALSTHSGDAA